MKPVIPLCNLQLSANRLIFGLVSGGRELGVRRRTLVAGSSRHNRTNTKHAP